MVEVEACSWTFVYKEWSKLRRMPIPDRGFERSFREYLYGKIEFDKISDTRDVGLGLSYSTLSGVSHELDTICMKRKDLFAFELKHYEVSDVTKDIVFTFWGKIMDFYLRNAEVLSNYVINLLFVTINRNIDDSIRKLCIALGVKLIEPSLMTLGTMDYFAGDLYQKMPTGAGDLKSRVEVFLEGLRELRDYCDYSFSDIFGYEDGKIVVESSSLLARPYPDQILERIREYNNSFFEVFETWKTESD